MNLKILIAVAFIIIISNSLSGCSQPEVIYVVKLSPPDMIEQFKLKQIDGFVAWEPFVTKGSMVGGKVLLTSSDIWRHHPCCVVAYSEKFKEEAALKAVVWAHVKATEFITDEKNREKVIEYASEFTGLEREVVAKAIGNIEFTTYPDEKEFRIYFENLKKYSLLSRKLSDLGFKDEEEFFSNFLRKDIYDSVRKMNEPPQYSGEVRIGYLTADLHQLALYVAIKEGYLDRTGIKYELKQYKNGVAVMEAFKAGEIEVAYLGGAPATLKRINDDIKIRIIAGANNEGSAIVVQKDITSVEDLKGKTIAIPGYGTVQDFLLRIVAEKHGMRIVSK